MIERPEQVRAVREAAGLSVADVARSLRLSPRHIEALEAGDWAALPGAAFARASLRSYARLLGIPVQALLDQMPQALDPELLRPATRLDARMPQGSPLFGLGGLRRKRLVLAAWTALVLVVCAVAVWLLQPIAWESLRDAVRARQVGGASVPPAAPGRALVDAPSVEATPSAALSATPPASSSEATGRTESPASQPAVPVAPITPPAAVSGPLPASSGPATVSGTLLIRTRQPSWIEIRDAQDRVLHMAIVQPTEPLRLELSGPVTYTIGNARETTLEWSGRPIDLAGQIKPGTSIAKGSLP